VKRATADAPSRVPPYLTLEAWRGLAALWVVLLHASLREIVEGGPALAAAPIRALILKGQLGVTMFFVISGYCIASAAVSARARPRPLPHFLRARIRRIYPPYYFSLALFVGASYGAAALASGDLSHTIGLGRADALRHGPLYYISTLTLTQSVFNQELVAIIYWSLCYEIAFYGIVALALIATARALGGGQLLYTLDALTIAALVWLNVSPTTLSFPFNLWHQFGLGIFVYHLAATPSGRAPRLLFAIAALLVISLAIVHGEGGDLDHPSPRVQSFVCLAFSLALICLQPIDLRLIRLRLVRFLAWVGGFSYSLYLTHVLVVTGSFQVFRRLPRSLADYPALRVLIQVAASVAFARLFYWLCERPYLNRPAAMKPVAPGQRIGEDLPT